MYTLPNCEHCHDAIELMKKNNIQFEQINTGSSDGNKKFKEFYAKYREQIERKEGKGAIDLPIVVYQDNGNQDNGNIRIHQGSEGLERFLGI